VKHPDVVLAEVGAVVGGHREDGVGEKAALLDGSQRASEALIDLEDRGVVERLEVAAVGLRRTAGRVEERAQRLAIEPVRVRAGVAGIEAIDLRRDAIGIVRVGEVQPNEQRTGGRVVGERDEPLEELDVVVAALDAIEARDLGAWQVRAADAHREIPGALKRRDRAREAARGSRAARDHAARRRKEAGEERRRRRPGVAALRDDILEANAATGEPVQKRRRRTAGAIAAEVVGAHGVERDEEDVRRRAGRRGDERRRAPCDHRRSGARAAAVDGEPERARVGGEIDRRRAPAARRRAGRLRSARLAKERLPCAGGALDLDAQLDRSARTRDRGLDGEPPRRRRRERPLDDAAVGGEERVDEPARRSWADGVRAGDRRVVLDAHRGGGRRRDELGIAADRLAQRERLDGDRLRAIGDEARLDGVGTRRYLDAPVEAGRAAGRALDGGALEAVLRQLGRRRVLDEKAGGLGRIEDARDHEVIAPRRHRERQRQREGARAIVGVEAGRAVGRLRAAPSRRRDEGAWIEIVAGRVEAGARWSEAARVGESLEEADRGDARLGVDDRASGPGRRALSSRRTGTGGERDEEDDAAHSLRLTRCPRASSSRSGSSARKRRSAARSSGRGSEASRSCSWCGSRARS
jgi:hypothetical protein